MIIQLVLFYYLKYANQNLPLTEFSLSFIGNIFNLAVFLLLMLGFVFLPKAQLQKKTINYFIGVSYLLLILSFIAANLNLPFEDIYILGQPGNKIIVAFVFTLYQWVLFSFCINFVVKYFQEEENFSLQIVYIWCSVAYLFSYRYFFVFRNE